MRCSKYSINMDDSNKLPLMGFGKIYPVLFQEVINTNSVGGFLRGNLMSVGYVGIQFF